LSNIIQNTNTKSKKSLKV